MGALALLLPFAQELIKKIWPDPEVQAQAQLKLAELAQSGELAKLAAETDLAKGQLAVNLAEAQQPRKWITWREGFGWMCVLTVGFKFIGGPCLFMLAQVFDFKVELPNIDSRELWLPLMGMLGLGTPDIINALKGQK